MRISGVVCISRDMRGDGPPAAGGAQVDQQRAQNSSRKQALCERDGRLWGVSICAPW